MPRFSVGKRIRMEDGPPVDYQSNVSDACNISSHVSTSQNLEGQTDDIYQQNEAHEMDFAENFSNNYSQKVLDDELEADQIADEVCEEEEENNDEDNEDIEEDLEDGDDYVNEYEEDEPDEDQQLTDKSVYYSTSTGSDLGEHRTIPPIRISMSGKGPAKIKRHDDETYERRRELQHTGSQCSSPVPALSAAMQQRTYSASTARAPIHVAGAGGFLSSAAESRQSRARGKHGRRGRPRGRLESGTTAASRQGTSDRSSSSQSHAQANSLYAMVKDGKASFQVIVDDWIEQYKQDRSSATLALNQFFITASGCKGIISLEMLQTMEDVAIIRRMTEQFDEESGEYPLIQAGQQWKRFRVNYCDFVDTLVKQCQYSIIYDQHLMDSVISFLTGLTDSQVRAFRHTATLGAMKLMTALVNIALTVSINQDNTQRQFDTERQKTRDKRCSDRLDSLTSKRTELEENMEEIKNMLTYIFKSVFVHRYRDIVPDIRSICMAEIGVWMKKFYQYFLDDSYLKYIGWTLYDKVGDVRLKCLQSLQPLYASQELKGKLELFTSKFKDRIVSMTIDKESEVAVQAVKLVTSILKFNRDILSDKDCEQVYELVYCSNRAVAVSAGQFLNERLFVTDVASPDLSVTRTKRGKRRKPNTPFIRDLVLFFIESELHEHGAYLVDSLIDTNPMMKDWECMTDLLLEEAGPNEEPMDNKCENSLIELMVCAVKQTATGEHPVARAPTHRPPMKSAREARQMSDDRTRLTQHFITALPHLLAKYAPDPEKAVNLLAVPQYFDLTVYTSSREEAALDTLLRSVVDVLEKHARDDVLETGAHTFEMLCVETHAIHSRCIIARDMYLDTIVSRLRDSVEDYMCLSDKPSDDETYSLVSSIRRVSVFYAFHDFSAFALWETLFRVIEEVKDGSRFYPDEAVKYCLSACMFDLVWSLHRIESMFSPLEGGDSQSETARIKQIELLALRSHLFVESCVCLFSRSLNRILVEQAYVCQCDYMIYFSPYMAQKAQHLKPLVCKVDAHLLAKLNDFIQCYVFVDPEESFEEHVRIEELHKRRSFLSGYCKLIVYNVIPIYSVSNILKHYLKYYNNYGDIIKWTLAKTREIHKGKCAQSINLALQSIFSNELLQNGKINRNEEEFISLKELAKRFSLTFGPDALKNREAITSLHHDGIRFALEPHIEQDDVEMHEDATDSSVPKSYPNVIYLEVIAEFTNRLLRQDRRVILNYLDKRLPSSLQTLIRDEPGHPWHIYRTSLLQGECTDGQYHGAPQSTHAAHFVTSPAQQKFRNKRQRQEDALPPERSPTRRSGRLRTANLNYNENNDEGEDFAR